MERAGCRDGGGAKERVREQKHAFALSITIHRKGTVRKPEAHPGLPKILAHPPLDSKQLVLCCSCRTQPLQFFVNTTTGDICTRQFVQAWRPLLTAELQALRINAPEPRALAGRRHAGSAAALERSVGAARTSREKARRTYL